MERRDIGSQGHSKIGVVKSFIKRVLAICGGPIDLFLAVLAFPGALLLLAYRKAGSGRLPITTDLLRKIGVFPIRNHYYEPLFDVAVLQQPLSQDRFLPGIDLDPTGQLNFLGQLTFAGELEAMDLAKPPRDAMSFWMLNGSFGSGDAEYLYQLARLIQPRRIIEIGSGHSTKILQAALRKNAFGSGTEASHKCIEPYEMDWLEHLGGVEVIRKRLEVCEIDWAGALQSGDLLFIDSSHMIRPQGDVLKEYLEILPQLASGVFVHVHDVFTPKDYLETWVKKDMLFWNEQYLLEAVLANTARYEIVGALNFLKHHHYEALKKACPYLTPDREPGSIYFRVR